MPESVDGVETSGFGRDVPSEITFAIDVDDDGLGERRLRSGCEADAGPARLPIRPLLRADAVGERLARGEEPTAP